MGLGQIGKRLKDKFLQLWVVDREYLEILEIQLDKVAVTEKREKKEPSFGN